MSTRYTGLKTVKHGSTTVTTCISATVSQQFKQIKDSGDIDAHTSFAAKGPGDTTVTLEIRDPVQARALIAAAASTFEFVGVPETGGTEVKVTISGVEWTGHNLSGAHAALHTQSLSGMAHKADGSDPVSVAPVGT